MKRTSVVLSALPLLFLALTVAAPLQTTPIDEKYAALGGSSSFLGPPTTQELNALVAGGRFRHYEHGSIYWSPDTGAHEIHGMIRDRWAAHGWERSYLGYPISDEMDTFDGAGRVSKFQFGDLIWRRATNAVSEVKSTDLALDLPFPAGLPWTVTQANAIGEKGSHRGPWAHCFDFTWAGAPMSGSNGRAFVAAASTEILYVEDGLGPGEEPGNVIIQKLGEGRYASYLHNQKGSYAANYGHGAMFLPQDSPGAWPRPRSGTVLAQVGDTGTGVGDYHLHFCVTTQPDRAALFGRRFESVPVAFQNYSVLGGRRGFLADGREARAAPERVASSRAGQAEPGVARGTRLVLRDQPRDGKWPRHGRPGHGKAGRRRQAEGQRCVGVGRNVAAGQSQCPPGQRRPVGVQHRQRPRVRQPESDRQVRGPVERSDGGRVGRRAGREVRPRAERDGHP